MKSQSVKLFNKRALIMRGFVFENIDNVSWWSWVEYRNWLVWAWTGWGIQHGYFWLEVQCEGRFEIHNAVYVSGAERRSPRNEVH